MHMPVLKPQSQPFSRVTYIPGRSASVCVIIDRFRIQYEIRVNPIIINLLTSLAYIPTAWDYPEAPFPAEMGIPVKLGGDPRNPAD